MKKSLFYNGIKLEASALSAETQSWLEWYNSLSPDMQKCVNNQPLDLLGVLAYQIHDAGQKESFNPGYWNTQLNIYRANCYAYSMDIVCSAQNVKLQPGSYAAASARNDNTVANNAYLNLLADIQQGGFGTVTAVTPIGTPPALPLAQNQSCVALVVAVFKDYHWYIQHTDGTWSHKRGLTDAINCDANDNFIDANNPPATCGRMYTDPQGNILDYRDFVGYYIVTH
ncbi:MAG: hypothetical protein LBI36_01835 [Oscillospiraceae bacterium]|jgi:hypothetical protein|nr:hypothetical protein [Oscillospiraceae bacterium]